MCSCIWRGLAVRAPSIAASGLSLGVKSHQNILRLCVSNSELWVSNFRLIQNCRAERLLLHLHASVVAEWFAMFRIGQWSLIYVLVSGPLWLVRVDAAPLWTCSWSLSKPLKGYNYMSWLQRIPHRDTTRTVNHLLVSFLRCWQWRLQDRNAFCDLVKPSSARLHS